MPDAVEVLQLRLGERLEREFPAQLIEDHAVQLVDVGPAERALAHPRHRRLVARAPRVGELRPVHAQSLARSEDLALADDRRAPVHHRTEYVERQCLDRHDFPFSCYD
jgi:hypothetical protein